MSYYQSEAYLRLADAARNRDYAQITQIIDDQVAATTGPEQAFWYLVRSSKQTYKPGRPDADLAWADLESALRAAPDDEPTRAGAMINSLLLFLHTERPGQLVSVVRLLGRDLPRLKRFWTYCYNIGLFHMLTGRMNLALGAMTRAIDGFMALPPLEADLQRGHLPRLHYWRAICAVANHLPEQAEADIAAGEQLFLTLSESSRSPLVPALARADLALYRRQWAEARSHLQAGVTQSGLNLHISSDRLLIKADLLAARIARAEGNQAGFRHFAEKALARTEYHDLPLSAALVRRVMDGADR